jgi:hypothetical protein
VQPGHAWGMDAERGEPARAWETCDGRRAPDIRHDQGPPRRDLDHLPRADAPYSLHARLHEAGEMGGSTQPPIRHEPIPGCSGGVDLVPLGEIVGEEGRDHPLQEDSRARLEPPQEPSDGDAAPRPRLRRWAERLLSCRDIGHGAPRASDENGAMPVPLPLIR